MNCRLTTIKQKNGRNYDLIIVGGGIVGLATARQLIINHPNMKFLVMENQEIRNSKLIWHHYIDVMMLLLGFVMCKLDFLKMHKPLDRRIRIIK